MATLEKLFIQGIRSFGAETNDIQSIAFNSPFTLIIGQNGCGKTTIIEALKYAITGVLPFGQGASFVRDPKLDFSTESYGQVKLKFRNVINKSLAVTRSLQTRQMSKKTEFKTLDVTLSVYENNQEKKQISNRCMDADEWIGDVFRVSKPILSSVIFCHQEDSYWPLDEGSKLKTKFDEIFDCTKYNKCVVKIMDLRKGVMKELLEMKTAISFLKENMDLASQKQKELGQKEKQCAEFKDQIVALETDIKEVENSNKSWRLKYELFTDLDKKQAQLKCSLKNVLEHQENERKEITHLFEGSEQELNDTIEKLETQLLQKMKARDAISSKIENLKRKERDTLSAISEMKEEVGRLESDQLYGIQLKKDRNTKINELAVLCELSKLADNADDKDFFSLSAKIGEVFERFHENIDQLKQAQKIEQHEYQLKINKYLQAKTMLESEIVSQRSKIAENEAHLKETTKLLKDADARAQDKVLLDEKLKKTQQALEDTMKTEDIEALSQEIEQLKNECNRLDKLQETLSEEVKSLNQHRSVQSKLADLEKKISNLKINISRSRSKSESSIKRLLKDSTDSCIKRDFDAMFTKLKLDIQQLTQQLSSKEREVSLLEQERKQLKSEIQQKDAELSKNEEAAYELFGRESYEESLKALDKLIEEVQDRKAFYQSSAYVVSGYISKLGETPCCPLCHRDFKGEEEVADIVAELSEKVNNLPVKVKEHMDKLNDLQQRQRKFLQFKPIEERTNILRTKEIPHLKAKLENIEEKLDMARHEVAALQASLTVPEEDRECAESMQSNVVDIDRYQRELKECIREMEELKSGLPDAGPYRSFEEAFAEKEEVQKTCNLKRCQKDSVEERLRKYNKQINELQSKVNALVAEQLQVEKTLQGREQLKERLEELSGLQPVLQAELDELLRRLRPAEEDLQDANKALRVLVQEHERKVRAQEIKLKEREKEQILLKKLSTDYKLFESKRVLQTLEELKSKCDVAVKEHQHLIQRREKTEENSTQLSCDIEGFQGRKSQLKRNLLFLEYGRQASKFKEDLKKVEADLGDIDIEGIQTKIQETFERKDMLVREKSNINGRRRELEDIIRDKKKELNSPMFLNADHKYRTKLIELTVKQHVEKDLQMYFKALEYALQHFHKDRMEAINRIIRELWRLIYRGNDIDYIEIKTDDITSTVASSGADKKRTYNYRVVQVKNGVELDMRGRCSAGQKVLACLIIRIALAEMFSEHCGILTLDEPTTNLDKENIRSLCNALQDIVQEHLGKKNFQLIVITHDRDFLEMLSHAEFFTHYYEVSRNHQSKSQIVKKEVEDS